jgi:LmeA-like phospholipid-binding
MSEDPTRPLPSEWPQQPGRASGAYRSPQQAYGSPHDAYRSPQSVSRSPEGGYRGAVPGRGRGRRRLTIAAVVVLVLAIILVIADRAAAAYAENQLASQIKSQGFPVKPNVTIAGFPFLTQLAARDFNEVNISASNVSEGPLNVASINAALHGVHIDSSFHGATVDQINGSALITFAGLASAAGLGNGITLSAAGPNEVKAAVNLGFLSGTALAQVTRSGTHQVNVRLISAGGIPLSALGSLQDFTITIPNLPAGMAVQSVSVTGQGLLIDIAATHASFGH